MGKADVGSLRMNDLCGANNQASAAEVLNLACLCQFLDADKLQHQLELEPALAGLAHEIALTRPGLFSASMVFISPTQRRQITELVWAIEQVVALPSWQQRHLQQAPAIAHPDWGPTGVFFGFDFHLGPEGPQLIEVNSNAGGALLNRALALAQTACCPSLQPWLQQATASVANLEADWVQMFMAEWQAQRGQGRPQCIAIVDDSPEQQYLYPEFRLAQAMFARAGIRALIADPQRLIWQNQQLWCDGQVVDMVYNRLTDFYLQQPANLALRQAYQAQAVVLTPSPRAHALYADKRHLVAWSSEAELIKLAVPEAIRAILLARIPTTQLVTEAQAESLWVQRKGLFFKPAQGFGSRAAYRGDKLTRRVWQQIVDSNDYVAQRLVVPSQRRINQGEQQHELKLDIRAYAYQGQVQLFAARLYDGQTTNFRTQGGGFAPVFITP